MNRYVIGGILASIVLLVGNGLGVLGQALTNLVGGGGNIELADDGLGTLPIEQAGRLAQRQSQVNQRSIPTASDNVINPAPVSEEGAFQDGMRSAPNQVNGSNTFNNQTLNNQVPGNVIPQGTTPVQPITGTGDISPLQPDLVRPAPQPADRDLDSIPALW